MKHFIVSLLVGFWLLGPHAFGVVNARNGVSISTASTINGRTPNSAINGQTIVSGGSPTLVASDNFDSYANDAALADYSPWTNSGFAAGKISKPASDGMVYSGYTNAERFVYYATTTSQDQRTVVEFDVTSGGSVIGPAVRCVAGQQTGYAAQAGPGPTPVYLIYVASGSVTVLSTSSNRTYATGDRLRIDVTGTSTATRITVSESIGGGAWTDIFTSVDPGTGNYIDNATVYSGLYTYGTSSGFFVTDWEVYDL